MSDFVVEGDSEIPFSKMLFTELQTADLFGLEASEEVMEQLDTLACSKLSWAESTHPREIKCEVAGIPTKKCILLL